MVGNFYSFSSLSTSKCCYEASWSFFPSTYRVTRDGQIRFGNSSLPDGSSCHGILGAIMAFEPNRSGALFTLSIDDAKGVGHVGIDYFELIIVSGGAPYVFPSQSSTMEFTNSSRINKDRKASNAPLLWTAAWGRTVDQSKVAASRVTVLGNNRDVVRIDSEVVGRPVPARSRCASRPR